MWLGWQPADDHPCHELTSGGNVDRDVEPWDESHADDDLLALTTDHARSAHG